MICGSDAPSRSLPCSRPAATRSPFLPAPCSAGSVLPGLGPAGAGRHGGTPHGCGRPGRPRVRHLDRRGYARRSGPGGALSPAGRHLHRRLRVEIRLPAARGRPVPHRRRRCHPRLRRRPFPCAAIRSPGTRAVPDWLMALSTAEKRKALDRHIDETAAYFAGQLHSWDVVNEPFWPGHGLPGGFRDGPWMEAFGEDYIERAFRRTAAADPNVRARSQRGDDGALGREPARPSATGCCNLVDRLQDRGVRLDAVGLQGHLLPDHPYDDHAFADFVAELATRRDRHLHHRTRRRRFELSRRYRGARRGGCRTLSRFPRRRARRAGSQDGDHLAARRFGELVLSRRARSRSERRRLPRPLPFDDRLQPKPARDAVDRRLRRRAGQSKLSAAAFRRSRSIRAPRSRSAASFQRARLRRGRSRAAP